MKKARHRDMTKEEILNAAKKWEDFLQALRRDFHESLNCPGRKPQTIARICTELRAVGLSPIEARWWCFSGNRGRCSWQNRAFAGGRGQSPVCGDPCNLLRKKKNVNKDPRRDVCGHDCHAAMLSLWEDLLQPVGIFLGLCLRLNAQQRGRQSPVSH